MSQVTVGSAALYNAAKNVYEGAVLCKKEKKGFKIRVLYS